MKRTKPKSQQRQDPKDAQLEEVLLKAKLPGRSAEYWKRFPRRVLSALSLIKKDEKKR
jgi:hypothetical protein